MMSQRVSTRQRTNTMKMAEYIKEREESQDEDTLDIEETKESSDDDYESSQFSTPSRSRESSVSSQANTASSPTTLNNEQLGTPNKSSRTLSNKIENAVTNQYVAREKTEKVQLNDQQLEEKKKKCEKATINCKTCRCTITAEQVHIKCTECNNSLHTGCVKLILNRSSNQYSSIYCNECASKISWEEMENQEVNVSAQDVGVPTRARILRNAEQIEENRLRAVAILKSKHETGQLSSMQPSKALPTEESDLVSHTMKKMSPKNIELLGQIKEDRMECEQLRLGGAMDKKDEQQINQDASDTTLLEHLATQSQTEKAVRNEEEVMTTGSESLPALSTVQKQKSVSEDPVNCQNDISEELSKWNGDNVEDGSKILFEDEEDQKSDEMVDSQARTALPASVSKLSELQESDTEWETEDETEEETEGEENNVPSDNDNSVSELNGLHTSHQLTQPKSTHQIGDSEVVDNEIIGIETNTDRDMDGKLMTCVENGDLNSASTTSKTENEDSELISKKPEEHASSETRINSSEPPNNISDEYSEFFTAINNSEGKVFQCSKCSFESSSKGGIKNHLRGTHKELGLGKEKKKNEQKDKCKKCSKFIHTEGAGQCIVCGGKEHFACTKTGKEFENEFRNGLLSFYCAECCLPGFRGTHSNMNAHYYTCNCEDIESNGHDDKCIRLEEQNNKVLQENKALLMDKSVLVKEVTELRQQVMVLKKEKEDNESKISLEKEQMEKKYKELEITYKKAKELSSYMQRASNDAIKDANMQNFKMEKEIHQLEKDKQRLTAENQTYENLLASQINQQRNIEKCTSKDANKKNSTAEEKKDKNEEVLAQAKDKKKEVKESDEKHVQYCHFYNNSQCTRRKCRFSHDDAPICDTYLQEGNCRQKLCMYYHPDTNMGMEDNSTNGKENYEPLTIQCSIDEPSRRVTTDEKNHRRNSQNARKSEKKRVPYCHFFNNSECTKAACTYLHEKAPICPLVADNGECWRRLCMYTHREEVQLEKNFHDGKITRPGQTKHRSAASMIETVSNTGTNHLVGNLIDSQCIMQKGMEQQSLEGQNLIYSPGNLGPPVLPPLPIPMQQTQAYPYPMNIPTQMQQLYQPQLWYHPQRRV